MAPTALNAEVLTKSDRIRIFRLGPVPNTDEYGSTERCANGNVSQRVYQRRYATETHQYFPCIVVTRMPWPFPECVAGVPSLWPTTTHQCRAATRTTKDSEQSYVHCRPHTSDEHFEPSSKSSTPCTLALDCGERDTPCFRRYNAK